MTFYFAHKKPTTWGRW